MAAQRGPVTGGGLPGTACAPDLFTRFDALQGLPNDAAQGPIRDKLGFDLKQPMSSKPGSFIRTIFQAVSPPKDSGPFKAALFGVAAFWWLAYWWIKAWL